MTTGEVVSAVPAVPEILQTVVIVEDESKDYLAAREQLSKLKLRNPIHRAHNVTGLMQFLEKAHRSGRGDGTALPCVIMMEMKLPQGSGLDGVTMVRGNAHFRSIPIIAISDETRRNTLKNAVQSGANAYLIKPFKGADFATLAAEHNVGLVFGDSAAEVEKKAKQRTVKSDTIGSSVVKKLGLFSF